jgi:hypothetical protein
MGRSVNLETQRGDRPKEISTLDDLTRTLQTSSIAIALRRTTPENPLPGEPAPAMTLGEVKSLFVALRGSKGVQWPFSRMESRAAEGRGRVG